MGVNLKVMFSFMVAHKEFDRVDSRRCDFLLWRDPFERTVSTFFDKCRQAAKDGAKVQNSQQLIMDAVGAGALGGIDLLGLSGIVLGPLAGALFITGWQIFTEERLAPTKCLS